ncbi:hypothetical protein [Bacillus mycoides]|uniref:hypothetical protein n=1 Tax=Bacillus mycoides TaxID=1405 RepID=UPI003D6539DB
MVRDDKLTSSEKKTIKRELESLLAEKASFVATADYYKITQDKTRYEAALNALSDYLTPILKDLSITSDVNGQVLRDNFKLVYDRRATLQRVISNKAKELADGAQGKADEAQGKASNALNQLGEMADDNKITPYEKLNIRKEWKIIMAEKPTLEAQANQYGVGGEKTAFIDAYNALDAYIKPILVPLVPSSTVNGEEFRNKFSGYYDNKIKLMRAIADKTKGIAEDAKNSAKDARQVADDAKNEIKNVKLDVIEKGKKWDAAYTRVDQWTAEGTTEVDGGKIKANSVIANKMAIGNWDNLFTNGTLEFGNQNFVGSNFEIVNDPANAHQGNHYLRVKWNGQFSDIYDSSPLKVIEGEQYFLEGQARLLSGSDSTRTFIVQVIDKLGKVITHYIGYDTLNTSWKEVSYKVTIPKGGVAIRIGISVGGEKNANNYTMFDSLFCKRMSEGKLIVDGSILARHIKTNELEVGDNVRVADGSISARHIKTDELEVGKNIKMGANAIISWDKVSNKPTAEKLGALPVNSPKITKIDNNGVYTGTVQTHQLIGNEIIGKTIKTSNTNEYLHMENQVVRFVNQGSAKIVMGFEDERKSKTRNPYIILGEGDGTGRNIGSIYKDGNGAYYRYVDYNGAESNIRLTNAGNIGITAQDGIWFTANRVNFTSPVATSGILFNSFGKTPLSQQGVLWMGNGYRGFGAYYHDGRAWNFISSSQ